MIVSPLPAVNRCTAFAISLGRHSSGPNILHPYCHDVKFCLVAEQVWFKQDLRTDDHPGLKLADDAASVLPVFCFDPALYTQLLRTPNGLQGVKLCGESFIDERRKRETQWVMQFPQRLPEKDYIVQPPNFRLLI